MIKLSLRLKVYATAIFFPITITRGVKAVLTTAILFGLFWPGCFRFFLRLWLLRLGLIVFVVLFHVVYFIKQHKIRCEFPGILTAITLEMSGHNDHFQKTKL